MLLGNLQAHASYQGLQVQLLKMQSPKRALVDPANISS